MKASQRAAQAAIAAISTVAAFTITAAPAHATGVTNNYASKVNLSATIYTNSWSTSKYSVSEFAENFVTVGSLGGACSPFCYWWEDLTSGDGTRLYDSPSYFSAESVDSPVDDWHGYVYSTVSVGAWTSASNITVDTATCC